MTAAVDFTTPARDGAVAVWLFVMAGLDLLMVIVGGATRLTDSGLSITEWRPLLGAIPPLDAPAWAQAFAKYKAIPQAAILNAHMTLAEFKVIYAWEWAHRLLGRLIGVAFAVPLAIFWARGALAPGLTGRLLAILALGALQGFMGWYMVQSGLTERIDVSQYRLAAHLLIATAIFAGLLWTALDVSAGTRAESGQVAAAARCWSAMLVGALVLQIGLGALVAGLKAGRAYNTWPLMDGRFVPDAVAVLDPWWINPFENIATAQFDHRLGAYAVLALALGQLVSLWRRADVELTRSAAWVAFASFAQGMIGIWALVTAVPIGLGLAHQTGALVVLALALWHRHRVMRGRSNRPMPAIAMRRPLS